MSRSDAWESILDENEEILWQGRPDPAFHVDWGKGIEMVFGLFFMGFSVFWMVGASQAGGVFWLFGLPFFLVGFFQVIGRHFWKTYLRRNSWYTLTNERAIIATDLPIKGKSLKSWPITTRTPLAITQGPPDTIIFAHEERRGQNGSYTIDIGFERIQDGLKVYQLMRDIQKGTS